MLSSSKWSEYISSGENVSVLSSHSFCYVASAKANVESSYITSLRVLCKLKKLLEKLKLFRPTDPDVEFFVTLNKLTYTRGLITINIKAYISDFFLAFLRRQSPELLKNMMDEVSINTAYRIRRRGPRPFHLCSP